MRMRIVSKALLTAAACALVIALAPGMSEAQTKSKAKARIAVPENGCLIQGAALNHGETCAAPCNETQWCPVNWCVMGKLEQTVFSCYEPSGLCQPRC